MLDRKYMVTNLQIRDEELQAEYRLAIQGKSKTAEDITSSSAAQIRHKCVRDRSIIALILELLYRSNINEIVNTDAVQGFEYLVNPVSRHRKATASVNNKDKLNL